jgi:pSer/pThr/pTyr-binding forkhead associated (FHA) protein
MSARLVSLDGQPDIPLDRLLVIVGRDRRCDMPVNSLRVSRRQCCLALESEGALVRDLGSVNGTWINGCRVEEGCLRPGDELAIAPLRYRLEFASSGNDPSRPLEDQSTLSGTLPTEGNPPT